MNAQDYLVTMQTLPEREGPAPRMTPANPQEQLEQFPADWQLIVELATHALALPNVVEQPTQTPCVRIVVASHKSRIV